jgi:uncharacterized tellurite resistance protein B-like protein
MNEHVETITNLLLGAAYADDRLEGDEIKAIHDILCKLLGAEELPESFNEQISGFDNAAFDVQAESAQLMMLSEDDKRKVLEMISTVHDADEELDLAEDEYLKNVAYGMGLDESSYGDLSLEIVEVEELAGALAPPPPPPPPPSGD